MGKALDYYRRAVNGRPWSSAMTVCAVKSRDAGANGDGGGEENDEV